jgi:hypothetical protein
MKSDLVIVSKAVLYIESIYYIFLKNMDYYIAVKGLILMDIGSSYTVANAAYCTLA